MKVPSLPRVNVSVTLDAGGGFYYLDRTQQPPRHVRLSGVTKPLKEYYWPAFTPWFKSTSAAAKAINKADAHTRALITKAKGKKKKWHSAQDVAKSNVRGSIVHRQLGDWIKHDVAHFNIRNPSGRHVLTKATLKALRAKHLVPFAADYVVACEERDVMLGTGIDLVCVNLQTNRLHFIELKTAHSRGRFYLDEPGIPFTGVLGQIRRRHPDKVSRSTCTRARVQLAVGVLMAVEGLGLKDEFDASVLLLNEDHAPEWIPVDMWFMKHVGLPIYHDLKQQLGAAKRARDDDNPEEEDDIDTRPLKRPRKI